jgi:8-oxo-dGTP diphosphatase
MPIAIAVVEHEGAFLVGQRPAGVALAGLWEFPGGKIDPGESAEAAAVRECLEETGLSVEPLFRYPDRVEQYDHDRVELCFVACRLALPRQVPPRAPFRWVPREEIHNYQFPAGNLGLLELLSASGDAANRSR